MYRLRHALGLARNSKRSRHCQAAISPTLSVRTEDRATMTKQAAIYLRVSTGGQSVEMQRRALHSAAERHGWQIAAEYVDEGISGTKGRDKRPGLDALCKAISRRQIDIVAAWSADRLARSLHHLVELCGLLQAKDVALYLDSSGIDTTTVYGKAMLQMAGVFAELERELIRERVIAGMAKAQVSGTKSGKAIGRPAAAPAIVEVIREHLVAGMGIRATARAAGCGNSLVQRVAAELRAG